MENELFKLVTRRWIAWGFVSVATLVLSFIAVWGAITEQTALVTLAGGGLLAELGVAIGFFFGKKTSEE